MYDNPPHPSPPQPSPPHPSPSLPSLPLPIPSLPPPLPSPPSPPPSSSRSLVITMALPTSDKSKILTSEEVTSKRCTVYGPLLYWLYVTVQ